MKRIYFDCETGAAPNAADLFNPEDVAIGNLKDVDKISAKIQEAKRKFVEDAALSPLTGMVLAVGHIGTGDSEPTIWTGEENTIVGTLLDEIVHCLHSGVTVVGFNCFSFDLPFLIKRAMCLGLYSGIGTLRNGRYWADGLVDLRDVWQMGDRQAHGSLDSIGKFLGLGGKSGNGAEFADLLKRDRDAAHAYLENDLRLTRSIGEVLLG